METPVPPKLASETPETLESALVWLTSAPSHRGRKLAKADLLSVFNRLLPGQADNAFVQLRNATKHGGRVGRVWVRVEGERRGTRYEFFAEEPPPRARPERKSGAAVGGMREFEPPTPPAASGAIDVFFGDNLEVIQRFEQRSFDLIYIDPPFNTGRTQSRTRITTERDEEGDRVGYQGRRYKTTIVGQSSYADSFDDYMAFLIPRLEEAHRLLKATGSLFLHLDYREVHYAKVALDQIFGRESFINEIVWSYDYGARATNRWSPKHDNILWYAKDPKNYCFNFDEIDRIPYMAPELVGAEKAERGKTPTDCWWHTIVSPNGKEKTGYPTQKPLGVLTRIVRVHSSPGDRLLDFFAGSGSFGEAAAQWGREAVLVDESQEAIAVMKRRFQNFTCRIHDAPAEGAPVSDVGAAFEALAAVDEAADAATGASSGDAADTAPAAAPPLAAAVPAPAPSRASTQEPASTSAIVRAHEISPAPVVVVPAASASASSKRPQRTAPGTRGQQTLF